MMYYRAESVCMEMHTELNYGGAARNGISGGKHVIGLGALTTPPPWPATLIIRKRVKCVLIW